MPDFSLVQLPMHDDRKGSLTVAELKQYIDWIPKRIYWVTKASEPRGCHAHRNEREFFVCLQGSLRAKIHDGKRWQEFHMKAGQGLHVPNMVWHEFDEFAQDAILLAASSTNYEGKTEYILDFNEFLKSV